MNKKQWAIIVVVAAVGWIGASGVLQDPVQVQLQDPLQQYYQPMQAKMHTQPTVIQKVIKKPKLVNEPVAPTAQHSSEKKQVVSSENKTLNNGKKAENNVPHSERVMVQTHELFLPEEIVPDVVPTFGFSQRLSENNFDGGRELEHVNLDTPSLDQLSLSNDATRPVSEDDKLQLLLLSDMVSWPTTIDHMAAEMLALSHSDSLRTDETVDPMQELAFLALSMMMQGEQEDIGDILDSDQLAMLTLSNVLSAESVYSPDLESGEMVLAQLGLADAQENAQIFNDLPAELALLAINDKHYKSRSERKYYKKDKNEYSQPKHYAKKKSRRYKEPRNNKYALQDYRTIDTWSAAEPHRTHTSKRHRSARHYTVPEKGLDMPRYEMARASIDPLLPSNSTDHIDMQTANAVNIPNTHSQKNNSDAALDLFAAPILIEDDPMLMADAEMPRNPNGLFSEPRLDKKRADPTGKVSGSFFYSTRLKSGSPVIGTRLSWKPYDKWVLRAGAKTVLFGGKNDASYSWGVGYEDWRPGAFSFALNNWGPIRRGDDPLKGVKFSMDYNVINKPTLFGFPISIGPSIDFPLQADAKLGRWAPTIGLGHTWKFKDHWFAKIGVSRALSPKAPWRWTYGFGRNSWKPFTFNVMYSNWGPNNDFRPNFRKNGRLSVQWKWMLEY